MLNEFVTVAIVVTGGLIMKGKQARRRRFGFSFNAHFYLLLNDSRSGREEAIKRVTETHKNGSNGKYHNLKPTNGVQGGRDGRRDEEMGTTFH